MGPLYYTYNKEPPTNSIGHCLGPYIIADSLRKLFSPPSPPPWTSWSGTACDGERVGGFRAQAVGALGLRSSFGGSGFAPVSSDESQLI